jgi:hypothetical protein
MKTKKWWILATIVGVSGFALWEARSQESEVSNRASSIAGQIRFATKGRDTLVGLDSIGVAIENLDLAALEAGLSPDHLQTDVELKLRLAGIKVSAGEPYLYVQVGTVKSPSAPIYAVAINVELDQKVFLARDPNIVTIGTTWHSGKVVYASKDKFVEGVRGRIRDLVDEFINDFLAANPRQQPEKNSEK